MAKKKAARPSKKNQMFKDVPPPAEPQPVPPVVDPRATALAQRLYALPDKRPKMRRYTRASALVNGMDEQYSAFAQWREEQRANSETAAAASDPEQPVDLQTFLARKMAANGGQELTDEEALDAMSEFEALEEQWADAGFANANEVSEPRTSSTEERFDETFNELAGVLAGDLEAGDCMSIANAIVLLRALFAEHGYSAEGLNELEEGW